MALPTFTNPLAAREAGYDAVPLTFGGIVYISDAGKELLANGAPAATAATASTAGVVKKGVAVAPCTVAADGTSAGTQLNALIASLKTAGVIS